MDAVADEEVVDGQPPAAARARDLDLGAIGDQGRRHVGGVRGDAAPALRHDVAHGAILLQAEAERLPPEQRLVVGAHHRRA